MAVREVAGRRDRSRALLRLRRALAALRRRRIRHRHARLKRQLAEHLPEGTRQRDDLLLTIWNGGARAALTLDDGDSDTAARLNLDAALEVCRSEQTDAFLVPVRATNFFRLAVQEQDRERFVAGLLGGKAGSPLYVRAFPAYGRPTRWCLVQDAQPEQLRSAAVLELGHFYVVRPSRLRLGSLHACQIEFWRRQDGALVGTRPNRVATRLPADSPRAAVRIQEREVATLAPFAAPQFDDVTFPVDVVYTWVDGSDPQWLARKQRVLNQPPTDDGDHPSRYRNRHELKFSLRSLARYAPWVRHVYLLTDAQRPDWLVDAHPRLTVVDHHDVFPAPVLPVYNSHAIETRLHRIPGLSEHFLYLNDDVVLGRPVPAEAFFASNGTARIFLSRSTIPVSPAGDPLTAARQLTQQRLVELTDRSAGQLLKHTPHPLRLDVLRELEERLPLDFARTAAHRLRAADDLIPVWLHHYYAYFTGRAIPSGIAYDYIEPSRRADVAKMRRLLRQRELDVFCINDVPTAEQSDEVDQRLDAFLTRYFPSPSPFEANPPRVDPDV